MAAASNEVVFLGPIYDKDVVKALRFHSLAYIHGHTVGGTNPSLVEAMAASNPVVAHDNPFNRWVLGEQGGWFFRGADDLAVLLANPPSAPARVEAARQAQAACRERFLWADILAAYGNIVDRLLARRR